MNKSYIMIRLNLISPDYKKMIKVKRILSDIQNLFLYIVLVVIAAAIILIVARQILEDNFLQIVGQTSLISRSPAENKINIEINKKIELAQKTQEDYIAWSRFIINFSKLVPDNVLISSLIVNPNENRTEWQINLSGIAANRDDFLTFKENLLEAKELFNEKEINIPITNLFQKENIQFNINIKIKKEILTNLKFE